MTDLPSFLGGEESDDLADAPAPAEAAVTEPEAETPAEGPARGPDGKFISAEQPKDPQPDPAPAPEPVVVAADPSKPPEGFVPVAALQALREEIRTLKQPPPPPAIPDPEEDPDGYQAFRQEQMQAAILNNRLDMSEDRAVEKYGAERVAAAVEWYKTQPLSRMHEIMSQRHPYDYLVTQAEAERLRAELTPTEIEAFRAWKASQAAGGQAPQPAPQPAAPAAPPAPAAPRSSIAAAPSAAGPSAAPAPDGEATYHRMFSR